MSTKTSPITPALLAWALQQDGRSVAELARALDLDRAVVEAWRAGDTQPTVGQVTGLAKALGRPRAFFFLPEPPTGSGLPAGFRHPPGATGNDVPARLLLRARRAKRLQQAIAATLQSQPPLALPQGTVEEPASAAATRTARWLGLESQTTWSDDYAALRDRRRTLEEAGILVFSLELGRGEVRGFAHSDEHAPLIVLNTSGVSPTARSFTLGHELAHLVLRDSTACVEPRSGKLTVDSRKERWCEAFSADLLMPEREVRTLMAQLNVGSGTADISSVKHMTKRFQVSARAAALRLVNLEFGAPSLYGAVLRVFQPRPRAAGTGTPMSPPRHQLRLRQYGASTVTHVLNTLPPRDALSVLGLTVEDTRRLAAEVPGVTSL